MTSLRRPPALRPGDRVAVLSASSPAGQESLDIGLDVLRFAGLEPVIYATARDTGSMRRYLAGDDAQRAGDLRSALCDPDIAGIVFAVGGSGAQRTLSAMDWSGIPVDSPKVLAGYSDVTAIQEAVAVKLGWASLHSALLISQDRYSMASLIQALMHPERVGELAYPDAKTVTGGRATGGTVGGNLTLLTSSLATDTSRPAAGGILLIEEVEEADYRIDRMLTQLRRSGYLDGVAGIICGTFTDCGEADEIEAILTERLADLGVPMIVWANVGHGGHFQTFPLGIAAELDADARTLRLLDPPLIPTS
jgi:muramoyltetrapeptide carboxypeptidase